MRILIIAFLLTSSFCHGQLPGFIGFKRPATNTPPPTFSLDTIFVNFWEVTRGGYNGGGRWNNINITTNADGAAFFPLKLKTGSASGISVAWRLNDLTTRAILGYNDNDNGTQGSYSSSSNGTGFPDSTLRTSIFTQTNDTRLMFTGLDNTKTYTVHILASRNSSTSRPVTVSFGSKSDAVDLSLNKTKVLTLTDLTPSSGTINLDMDFTNGFWVINAFALIIKTPL